MLKDYFLNEVDSAIKKAIESAKLGQMTSDDKYSLIVEKPKNADFGDFAVNVSSLARSAKIAPPMIAQAIVEFLSKEKYSVTVVGGFINFKIEDSLLANAVAEVLAKGENYGKPENVETEKILLEYVSANPTGPFHIGHGRWAAMGSALANLLKFYGHEVYQEFYINDAGSQIQKLGNSLRIRLQQEKGENVDFPTDEIERKNYYPGDYLIPVAKKFLELNPTVDVDNVELNILCDFAKKEMEERIASVKVGTIMEGKVESLQNYGAFVRLEDDLSGLVHVSQISHKRVKSPKDVLNVGDDVKVKVIGIKEGKISLSMKALEEVVEEEPEEKVVIPKSENIGTSLGDLFKNIKL